MAETAMSKCVTHQLDSEARDTSPAQPQRLSDDTIGSVAAMLRILADPTRLRLIELLHERGQATVGALTACLPVTQQTVSKQLSLLYQVGVVRRQREGMCVQYELADFSGWWLVEQLAGTVTAS
jgi:DNA-binding transcriptional ArsR family regulator